MDLSNNELLKYAIDNGMIDINTIQKQIEMKKRKEYLDMHEYEIWQGSSDGYWRTYFPDEDKGRILKKRKTKSDIENLIVDFYMDNKKIKDVYFEWIEEKLEYGEIQKQTYDKYNTDFERFFINNESSTSIMKKRFSNIDEDDLERFIKLTISKLNLSRKAYGGLKIIINGVFKYGKKKKYTSLSITNFMGDLDLSRKIFKPAIKDKSKEVYQEEEAEIMTGYLRTKTEDIRCLGLLLSFETGLRVGELCGLKKSDIRGPVIHVKNTEIKYKNPDGKWVFEVREYPKTDAGIRDIILTESARNTIDMILRLNPFGEYVFSEKGKRIGSSAFRRKLMRVCNTLNIDYRSNHKIRKTYGTMLIDSKVDDSLVAEQMGHKDISTTKKYYYFSNKSEERKREQICNAISI